MMIKKQKPKEESPPLRKRTANYIYVLVASLVFAGTYNFFSKDSLGILDGIINILLGVILFFTARHLQNGSIRSVYIGSLAIAILMFYGFLKDTRLILLSLVMPVIFYFIVYKLWKDGELK